MVIDNQANNTQSNLYLITCPMRINYDNVLEDFISGIWSGKVALRQ